MNADEQPTPPRLDPVAVTRALANMSRAVEQFVKALHPAMQQFAADLGRVGKEMREAGLIDGNGRLRHAARGTNAEDCPACSAAVTTGHAPAYPFICPGPDRQ